MTAKEYLWRVRDAERELKQVEQEYKQAKEDILRLKAIQYDRRKVGNSHIGDLSDAIAEIESYAERINVKWDNLIALREEAKARIEQIQNGRYREVLVRRYLWGMTFAQIAVGMGFDYRWTRRLHGRALREFQKLTLESPL